MAMSLVAGEFETIDFYLIQTDFSMLIDVFDMRMLTKYIISFIHAIKTFYKIDT